jgi:hypothetical protein
MLIWEIEFIVVLAVAVLLVLILACFGRNSKGTESPNAGSRTSTKYKGHVSDLISSIHSIDDIHVDPVPKSTPSKNSNVFDIIRDIHSNAET